MLKFALKNMAIKKAKIALIVLSVVISASVAILAYNISEQVDDGFKMHLTFESGLTAVMEVGTCHFANLPLWYVAGTDGTAIINNWECEGKLVRLSSWEDKDATPILAGAGLTKTMAPRGDGSTQTLPLPKV